MDDPDFIVKTEILNGHRVRVRVPVTKMTWEEDLVETEPIIAKAAKYLDLKAANAAVLDS